MREFKRMTKRDPPLPLPVTDEKSPMFVLVPVTDELFVKELEGAGSLKEVSNSLAPKTGLRAFKV